jgi:hypothetical protein
MAELSMRSLRLVPGTFRMLAEVALLSLPAGCGSEASHAGPIGGALPEGGTLAEAGAPSCPETPPTLHAAGTVVTFQTDPVLGGKAMIYGEPNALPGGGTLTPLNLRYFLSNVTLVRGDGSLVPVDIVTATGALEPYGVHLFNAEDPPSTSWSIRAPAGSYREMNVMLGISDACNAMDNLLPGPQSFLSAGALGADSQLTWPPPFGYLFLRFEARIDTVGSDGGTPSGGGIDGGVEPISAIAMGGFIHQLFAPIVHVDQPLTVPASGPVTRHLRFDMDQVFKGATANVDVSRVPPGAPGGGGPPPAPPGTGETIAGERLRQTAPQLALFVLDP